MNAYLVSITGLKDSDLFLQRYVRAGVATMSEESVVALRKQKLFYIHVLFSTIVILFPFIYYYPTTLLFYYPLKLKIVRLFSTCWGNKHVFTLANFMSWEYRRTFWRLLWPNWPNSIARRIGIIAAIFGQKWIASFIISQWRPLSSTLSAPFCSKH